VSLPLEFHPAVPDDIDNAYQWYEQRRPGLGGDFLDEFERLLALVGANPPLYGRVEGDIRAGLLARFPYAVYYRALPDRVRVLAVYHTSRHSSGWRLRRT
jgi:toxin ParE1/3/4